VSFNVADLERITEIVKTQHRRQVSEAERQRSAPLSTQYGSKLHHSGCSQRPLTPANTPANQLIRLTAHGGVERYFPSDKRHIVHLYPRAIQVRMTEVTKLTLYLADSLYAREPVSLKYEAMRWTRRTVHPQSPL